MCSWRDGLILPQRSILALILEYKSVKPNLTHWSKITRWHGANETEEHRSM